jgi:hypothetical protein
MTKSRETWYRNSSFWGSIGATAALVFAIAAFLARDLQWLLMVAWPFGCLAVWSLVRSVFATRGEVRLAAIMGSLMLGLALLYLHSFMKPVEDLPATEQARLEIRNTVVPTSRNGSPALNISFYNAGKFPATNVGHYYTLATAARILTEKEVTDIQDRALGFLKLGQSPEELSPGQPNDPSFTIPENPGEQRTSELLSRDLDHVVDGSRLMYLVVDFSYRDRTTPKDAYRISESCVYFTRTLQSGHACGRNGTSLEKMDTPSPP